MRLANGKTKPISKVRVGDRVLATDPRTGRTELRRVTALIVGDGEKRLVRLWIGGTTTTATDGHPFWVEARQSWVDADDLRAGDTLRRADGTTATVTATTVYSDPSERVYNLTVEGIHTYYAGAGGGAVLVHNCDLEAMSAAGHAPVKGGRTAAGRAYQKHMDRGELPKVPGKQLDEAGQNTLDDILTTPGARIESTSGGGTRVVPPNGGTGATFRPDGSLKYFGQH